MSKLRKVDNLDAFTKGVDRTADEVLEFMAVQIEGKAKMKVPQKTSHLQNRIQFKQVSPHQWLVYVADVPYALYQHEGQRQDGSHKVRQYSNPHASKHYLLDPALEVVRSAERFIKAHLERVRP